MPLHVLRLGPVGNIIVQMSIMLIKSSPIQFPGARFLFINFHLIFFVFLNEYAKLLKKVFRIWIVLLSKYKVFLLIFI